MTTKGSTAATTAWMVLVLLMVAFTANNRVSGLSCRCKPQDQCPIPTGCKGGLARDPCGCCDVCAKVLDEVCGGPWNIKGRCDEGLKCKKKSPKDFNGEGLCTFDSAEPLANPSKKTCAVHYLITSLPSWFCTADQAVYCTRDCQQCCHHDTSCNPDPFKFVDGSRCTASSANN